MLGQSRAPMPIQEVAGSARNSHNAFPSTTASSTLTIIKVPVQALARHRSPGRVKAQKS